MNKLVELIRNLAKAKLPDDLANYVFVNLEAKAEPLKFTRPRAPLEEAPLVPKLEELEDPFDAAMAAEDEPSTVLAAHKKPKQSKRRRNIFEDFEKTFKVPPSQRAERDE